MLIYTTHERAKQNLKQIQAQIKELGIEDSVISESPPILQISCLKLCMGSEKLLLSVDTLTGLILAHVPHFEESSIVEELQTVLRKDVSKCQPYFAKLKLWALKDRFKKTVEMLPVFVYEKLPFIFTNNDAPLETGPNKLFVQFVKNPKNFILVVLDSDINLEESKHQYYLLTVDNVPLENVSRSTPFETELPKVYVRLNSIFELDLKSILTTKYNKATNETANFGNAFGKRKLLSSEPSESNKKSKLSTFFVPEFAHLVSFCEERLACGALSNELQRRSICHQVKISDETSYSHLIDVIQLPPEILGENCKLTSNLISCTMRLQGKNSKIWIVAVTFFTHPLLSSAFKEANFRKTVYLMYDFSNGSQAQIVKMVEHLIDDLRAISKLYNVVFDFAENVNSGNYVNIIEIKSFSYKKFILGYGQNKNYTLSIHWKSSEKRYHLSFGVSGVSSSSSNPHVIVSSQLQQEFNQSHSIANLVQTLNSTLAPLLTLQNLISTPLLGAINSKPQFPVQTFCMTPQSSTHLRLLYRNAFCVDIVLQPDNLVSIRDGAYSLFDKAKVLEDLSPIQGLKAFLSKFVDTNATVMRRLSQIEDDNPPSPVTHFDPMDWLLYQSNQNQTSSPMTSSIDTNPSSGPANTSAGSNMRNLRQSLTPGSLGSHPNTPASPHTSVLSQSAYVSSPSTNFPLSSPPSHNFQPTSYTGQIAPSPPVSNVNHPEPSLGNIFGVQSPMNQLHALSPSFLPIPSPSGPSSNIHSPASNFQIHSSSQVSHEYSVNSPFPAQSSSNISMPSPASMVWPNSPSMARRSPSRPIQTMQSSNQAAVLGSGPQTPNISQPLYHNISNNVPPANRFLPRRPWAAAMPTVLTHQGFNDMCKLNAPFVASHAPHYNSVFASLSQLERFLGCVFMKKNLHRLLTNDEEVRIVS